jgi:signal transduction histidine kinase
MFGLVVALGIGFLLLFAAVGGAPATPGSAFARMYIQQASMPLEILQIVCRAVSVLAFSTVGAIIVSRYPTHAIGWLFCTIGLLGVAEPFTAYYALYTLFVVPGSLPGGPVAGWFQNWIEFVSAMLLIAFVPLLFPTGRLSSARWKPVCWLAVGATVARVLDFALYRGPLFNYLTGLDVSNPLGVVDISFVFSVMSYTVYALYLTAMVLATASLVARLRRARGDERQQIKWFIYVGVVVATEVVVANILNSNYLGVSSQVAQAFNIAWWFELAALPLVIGLSILRYRLFDIDVIIRRTLVYGALTAGVVGIYVLVVGYLGAAFRTGSNLLISLVATGLVAVLFQPLRGWLQRGVNRLLYGQRDDPYGVLARLDTRLALAIPAETVLPTIVETVATALKLPYAAIALAPHEPTGSGPSPADSLPAADDPSPAAAHGKPSVGTSAAPLTRLPLAYGAETVGYLLLAPRPGEGGFAPADRRLLDELAAHAGVVVHAVRLTGDLQHARERLVTAREEERRRLRRDLHDGLGPQLASFTLTLAAARGFVARDPARADAILGELATHVQGAMSDVRRLVYALRPPALDDLGLVGALGEQAARYELGGLDVQVEADPQLAPLSAAVEVAAYRICLEALANVARHAGARHCVIRLGLERGLTVEVVDDGVGIAPGAAAGVGLRSMRERAEELGGSCVVEPAPGGGTHVRAHWPFKEA